MGDELKVESTITRSETYWDVVVNGFWYSCDSNFKSTASNLLQHQSKKHLFHSLKAIVQKNTNMKGSYIVSIIYIPANTRSFYSKSMDYK